MTRVMHQPKEGDQNDCDQEDTEEHTDEKAENNEDPGDKLFRGSNIPARGYGIAIKVPDWDWLRKVIF